MKLPDKVFGISTKEAYERYLKESEKQKAEPPKPSPIPTAGINLENYLFLPAHSLYVAKQRSHLGKKWEEAHQELHKENARMLTLREFIDFLLLLRSGNVQDGLGNIVSGQEVTAIYNEITEKRSPWRAEWIDAYFKEVGDSLQIHYNHRIVKGKLQPKNTESLEQHLAEDRTPGIDLDDWLNRASKHGLPPDDVKSGSLWYWHPRQDRVSWFGANSDWAFLYCVVDPRGSNSALGVFACAEGTPLKN